ncbi:rab11 family-interacting protein 3-like [Stigmatopora argus]
MEATVVSSPLGHPQTFPLGFLTLDSNNGGMLCPNNSGQTGLRFGDPSLTTAPSEMDQVYQDAPVELDKLLYLSDYPCGDLFFEDRQSETSSPSDRNVEPDDTADFTLSWLFSPNLTDVVGANFVFEEASLGSNNVLNGQTELTLDGGLQSKWNSESNPSDSLIPVDLLPEDQATVASESHAVSEGPLHLPGEGRVTWSHETGDKGLFPDRVTTLSVNSSSTPLGPSENSLPLHHSRTPEGSLLDLEDPDLDNGLLLCPENPQGADLDLNQDFNVEDVAPSEFRTSEQPDESESPLVILSRTSSLSEDGLVQGALSTERSSDDLIQSTLPPTVERPASESMSLDCHLTNDGILKTEELRGEAASDVATDQREEEQSPPANPSLDFNVLELNHCTEDDRWTSEQDVDTLSLSKMMADDSLPILSVVNPSEEDESPLKTVFDALDQDGDGFVRIEEFVEFAAAYGADQVKDLTKFLDPSGLGVISFEDFHRGISAISNGGPEPKMYNANYSPGDGAVGCPEEYDEQNEVTDSAYLGSESTYSECETFTDEDTGALVPPEMHEDVDADSGIEAALHDPEEAINRFSLNAELHNASLVAVISGEEEHFEDFGESNHSELLLESVEDGPDGSPHAPLGQTPQQIQVASLLSPSAPAPLPDCFQSFLKEEALDFFCSQCHKQISRLEDLSTRLNFLEMTSSGKRLSSKKVARHLLQNSSITLDTVSDLTRDILELADNDITDKMLLLERRVGELEKESETSGEQHARLRQENLQLVHRANAFEEQLKEQELMADQQLQNETRRHKEALGKLERDRGMELENLQARLQQLDEENCELRSSVPCLRANIERLEEEKQKLEDEVDIMDDKWQCEMETRQKMTDKLSHERHQNQREKESTQELIEDLRKQLEHLQLYKLEAEAKRGRSPGAGLQEYQSRTREAELEQEIKRLKQDNRSLKEQNDELNGQIINLSIQGAKSLMSASFSDSLAAEINSVSRSELMEAVHKQEEINYRLQDYIDKIIVAIMESNPSILEVK